MAMTLCPACGEETLDQLVSCPLCEEPLTKEQQKEISNQQLLWHGIVTLAAMTLATAGNAMGLTKFAIAMGVIFLISLVVFFFKLLSAR
jgi:predicted nucleic acid-binding Zn ribbon protein